MASDSDKSLSNHNLDGSLKSVKKQNSSGNIGKSGIIILCLIEKFYPL